MPIQAIEAETTMRKKEAEDYAAAKDEMDKATALSHFFSARRFERAIRKIPNTVRCLAILGALFATKMHFSLRICIFLCHECIMIK